jgi:hypothetical protein
MLSIALYSSNRYLDTKLLLISCHSFFSCLQKKRVPSCMFISPSPNQHSYAASLFPLPRPSLIIARCLFPMRPFTSRCRRTSCFFFVRFNVSCHTPLSLTWSVDAFFAFYYFSGLVLSIIVFRTAHPFFPPKLICS